MAGSEAVLSPGADVVKMMTSDSTNEKIEAEGKKLGPEMDPNGLDSPLPRNFSIDDPFCYVPGKPKDDQWTLILKPLMEQDGARCKAWKEEVENLLIFAGLFSAVVTAFVIESYKFLQQDPNEAIVGLLLHIANRLDGPLASNLNGTSTAASIIGSFSRDSSSIRINIFWFISLILSLTTVLGGTISLQWLREHQSYPMEFSPKKTLAVFHMHSKAMEVWYVPQIFAALPLLLQGALVLFFAGMIDFLLLLGSSVAIPVCVLIGMTLLFLLATTILPTLQGFVMYLPLLLPRNMVPTPCPYKSPQSHAFCALSNVVFSLLHFVIPAVYYPLDTIQRLKVNSQNLTWFSFIAKKHHVIPYISDIWCRKTWSEFDLGWLFLRDAFQQRVFDKEVEVYEAREKLFKLWSESKDFPLCDVVQSLREAVEGVPGLKHTDTFLVAAYHCLGEVSKPLVVLEHDLFNNPYLRSHHQNHYFHKLLDSDGDLSQFLAHHGMHNGHVLHYEHLYEFVGKILQKHPLLKVLHISMIR